MQGFNPGSNNGGRRRVVAWCGLGSPNHDLFVTCLLFVNPWLCSEAVNRASSITFNEVSFGVSVKDTMYAWLGKGNRI